MEVVKEFVPTNIRLGIYSAYVVAGLIVGAIEAAGGLSWTPAALDVLAYLAVPLAVLAGTNVPGKDGMDVEEYAIMEPDDWGDADGDNA